MRIAAINAVQGIPDVSELILSKVYLKNLEAKIFLKKGDISKLGLRHDKEIALCFRCKDSLSPSGDPEARITCTVQEFSTRLARDWYREGQLVEYVNIEALFDAGLIGNLLLEKEHADTMELSMGDTILLKIQPIKNCVN